MRRLQDAAGVDQRDARIRAALATDVESIESIGAVRAVFEKIFL